MSVPQRVLGIDHGLHHTGYGCVWQTGSRLRCIGWGVITTTAKTSLAQRLNKIFEELLIVIDRWQPDTLAVEAAIYAQNIRTALLMGHARGVALLAGASRNLEIFEYSPKKIKSAVVGNGAASKDQVRYMVTRILDLPEPALPPDASDALAVGICHLNQWKLRLS
ncbi:MAG: crossover junction endodeoxyribonuclease RuvC [Deltaproteobacteria bacterium]|nr:MAG: crossover junction endodeoxyribonuclease RuvC [Deltaproteobacteria bacterium]RLF30747.1 MAG: crossover junction endodeoxyribonuclease RuvC [Thermoplasmata archaeon]